MDIIEQFIDELADNSSRKEMMKALLTNQFAHIDSMKTINQQKDSLCDVAKIYENMISLNFVGTQPMNSDVGLSYVLRHREFKNPDPRDEWVWNAKEHAYVPVDVYEIDPMKANKISEEKFAELVSEYDNTPKLMLSIMKSAVEAKEVPITNSDFSIGLDKYIFDEIMNASTKVTIDLDSSRKSAEKLSLMFMSNAHTIATETRRGCGNIILLSDSVFELYKDSAFFTIDEDFKKQSFCHAGKQNGTIDIYYTNEYDGDFALIAYRGDNEVDAGVVFAPYITKFSESVSKFGLTFCSSEMVDSSKYFKLLEVKIK